MKRSQLIRYFCRAAAAVALMLVLIFLSANYSLAQALPDFRAGEVVVELNPGASIEGVNARNRTTTILRIYGTNFYRLAVPSGKKDKKWRKRLAKDPDVLSASLNPIVANPINVFARSIANFPDDKAAPGRSAEDYRSQLDMINLRDAQLRSTGEGVVVAIIDTGVDRGHPALAARLYVDSRDNNNNGVDDDGDGLIDEARGWDFVSNDNDPGESFEDPQTTVAGHGTFIAGLIALVAPDARLLPVRAFSSNGVSDAFTVAAAIKYAADHGAQVINLSLGSSEQSAVLRDAVLYARQRGAIILAAVGNDDRDMDTSPQFPASWQSDAVGVAAVDLSDRKASFSNFGGGVAVAAPGVRLVSAFPGGGYAIWSGTSFAAPLAAGEAALVLGLQSYHPNPRDIIESTSVNIDGKNPGFAGKLGRGRIDPLSAVQRLSTPASTHTNLLLMPTTAAPQASGKAELSVSGGKQEFEVEATGLGVNAPYKILVNGALILDGAVNGRAKANSFGGLKVEFSTAPSGGDLLLPPALNPLSGINRVEIQDAQGQVALISLGFSGGPDSASVDKLAQLIPASATSRASGMATAESKSGRERLKVRAEGLVSGAAYQLVVDGYLVGSYVAQRSSDSGFLRLEFANDGSEDLPIPILLTPVTKLKRVELRDQAGQVILAGDFHAGDDSSGNVRVSKSLDRTGADPDAEGRIDVDAQDGREELKIEAENLNPGGGYEIVIDGTSLGNFTADNSGKLKLEWSTEPGKLPLPAAVRPLTRIRVIQVRIAGGLVVLSSILL